MNFFWPVAARPLMIVELKFVAQHVKILYVKLLSNVHVFEFAFPQKQNEIQWTRWSWKSILHSFLSAFPSVHSFYSFPSFHSFYSFPSIHSFYSFPSIHSFYSFPSFHSFYSFHSVHSSLFPPPFSKNEKVEQEWIVLTSDYFDRCDLPVLCNRVCCSTRTCSYDACNW